MIQINHRDKILVATAPVDFRSGIDSLCGFCKRELDKDPFSGTLFVFCNKSKTALKILVYDSQGFWLMQKRFSRGHLAWWPQSHDKAALIDPKNFLFLIFNGDPATMKFQSNWKNLDPP